MDNQVRNRIDEIKRPSVERPRKYTPKEIDYSEWDKVKPIFSELIDRSLTNKEEVENWLLDMSEVFAVISEESSRRYISMTCATDDQEVENAYLHFIENISPRLKPVGDMLDRKLLDCQYSQDLDTKRYDVLIRSTKNQVELFREENIPLETELNKLSQKYQKTMGAMMVNFHDKEHTMQQMGIYLVQNDRNLRKDAFEKSVERRLEDTEKLEDIFDEMLKLRVKVAKNAGFENYRDYMFRRYDRFDYTPADCFAFHKAVEKHVVPLNRAGTKGRQQALSIDSVRPYDVACDRYGRSPLKPFDNTKKLTQGCQEIFHLVDGDLGLQFQKMIDMGLLDLDSRKGKAPGGYQSSLSEVRLPFIFMNVVGLNRDVTTLLHEGGHAFHQFAVSEEPLISYRHAPMEFSEVASMSMEHLGAPHLGVFYSEQEAARARYDQFDGDISILPWIATVDAFQHWIYENPDHTRDERSNYWLELRQRFGAGIDHSGYEKAQRYRWHTQLHIFEVPFYYIEYGIALLGALQVWRNSLTDLPAAVEAYKSALALGGSKPLPDLFTAADTEFDFSDRIIEPVMQNVAAEVERQSELEKR